jgi:hypothetical protein
MEIGIDCIQTSSKNKHKREIFCSKYKEQALEFKRRIERIRAEYEGMKMMIRLSVSKMRWLNTKMEMMGNGNKGKS